MRFKVKDGIPIRDLNEDIDAVPEFKGCSDKVLRYTFLMYDYESPYARMPEDNRKKLVMGAIGYDNANTIRSFIHRYGGHIEKAKTVLRRMQFSLEHESLLAMKAQLARWNKELLDGATDKKKKQSAAQQKITVQIFDKLPDYIKRIKDLEKIVGYIDEEEDAALSDMTSLELYMKSKQIDESAA